jgi:hypothetical protein
VVAESGDEDRFLRAQAVAEPLFAVFSVFPVSEFEYEATLRFPKDAAKGVTMVFGYTDEGNHGRVELDPISGTIRAVQRINGNQTVLVEKKAAIPTGEWFEIGIQVEESELEINFDDDTMEFETELRTPLQKAPVGFLVPANGTVEFEELVVEDDAERS